MQNNYNPNPVTIFASLLISFNTVGDVIFSLENNDTCSFCGEELIDDSIRFKGISACAICLQKNTTFDQNLREYQKQRRFRYGS